MAPSPVVVAEEHPAEEEPGEDVVVVYILSESDLDLWMVRRKKEMNNCVTVYFELLHQDQTMKYLFSSID